MRRPALTAVLFLALAACAVGPTYHRPSVDGSTAAWIGSAGPGRVDTAWWRALHDPQLDALVDAALAHNLDVREAEANLRQARANREAAGSALAPTLEASGSAAETEISANGQLPLNRLPGFSRRFSLFDGGFDASWELDFWGAVRRTVEGARARDAESAARLDGTRLQVVAEVARSYADLRAAQARLASAREDAGLREQIVALVEQRLTAGESAQTDLAAARQRLGAARAAPPGLEAQARAAAYRLALLTGRPPEAGLDLLTAAASLPAPPDIVASDIRSDMLERRPDVRVAEADLAAATADIGVQTANLYPRFAVMGAVGQQSRSVADLALAGSTRFNAGPSFSWPIFSAGRIRAQIRASKAGADAAAARYERAVLSALSDSETALNRYANALEAARRDDEALRESERLTGLAGDRFQKGEDDRIAWLEAQSARRAAEQSAIAARADAVDDYISLEKALAGGWGAR